MGAAAVNAIIAPWFVRQRPAALSFAYNGASIGGVVFSPLWVAAIGSLGFALASALIGLVMIVTIWILTNLYYAREPEEDGTERRRCRASLRCDSCHYALDAPTSRQLISWRDLRFITLAAAMALGLFAQIGLLTHLFSLLVTPLGTQLAGIATGAATAAAIAGRTFVGWLMPAGADRRLFGCASYFVQMLGSLALLFAAGDNIPLLALGVVLFGAGIGNATSLPPLIAQAEFVRDDVARAVPMIVAIAQASSLCIRTSRVRPDPGIRSRNWFDPGERRTVRFLFITAALMQCLAIGALLVGRRR